MLIVNEFKDLSMSAARIAEKFNVSDTYAIQTFEKYVKLDRLPLSDIISIDEVHVDLDDYCRYALVIQDFYTGDLSTYFEVDARTSQNLTLFLYHEKNGIR